MRTIATRLGRRLLAAAALGAALAASGVEAAAPDVSLRRRIAAELRADELERALELIERHLEREPGDGVMLYNAACAHCRLGRTEVAMAYLVDAVKAGYVNFSHMRRDPDLVPLRSHRRFRALLAARDAADGLLADRREAHWRERLGADATVATDAALRLTVIAAGGDAAAVRDELAPLGRHLAGVFGGPPDHAFTVVVLPEARLRSLVGAAHVAGRYRHAQRELVATGDRAALRHELVHAFHHGHMDRLGQRHAMWIQEGLAALYEAHALDGAEGVAFHANERRNVAKMLARRDRLMAWRDLAALSDHELQRLAATTYAQVRSMMLFIAESGRLEAFYEAYVDGFDADPTGLAALEAAFDRPAAEIERAWRRWLDERPVVVGPPPGVPSPAEGAAAPGSRPCPAASREAAAVK